VIDQIRGALGSDADVVLVEFRRAPQPRVPRLDQNANVFRIDTFQGVRADAPARGHFDDPGSADQEFERQRFDAVAGVEEMTGCVDMRAGVSAHMERRHVGASSLGDAFDRLEGKRRVAGVNGKRAI
jgi:hypothetical protein